MTLDEQARLMTDGTNMTIADGVAALKTVGEFLAHHVAKGEEVRLPGMGHFVKRPTKARTARNPQTGETVQIPAGFRVGFRPAKSLREAL